MKPQSQAGAALHEARKLIHEAQCRELESDTLRRRNGRWYVKRAGNWQPLDPQVFEEVEHV